MFRVLRKIAREKTATNYVDSIIKGGKDYKKYSLLFL